MKKLLSAADAYIAKMNWKDLALVKLCLCAAGVMLGLAAPKKLRKWAALGAVAVYYLLLHLFGRRLETDIIFQIKKL